MTQGRRSAHQPWAECWNPVGIQECRPGRKDHCNAFLNALDSPCALTTISRHEYLCTYHHLRRTQRTYLGHDTGFPKRVIQIAWRDYRRTRGWGFNGHRGLVFSFPLTEATESSRQPLARSFGPAAWGVLFWRYHLLRSLGGKPVHKSGACFQAIHIRTLDPGYLAGRVQHDFNPCPPAFSSRHFHDIPFEAVH